MNRVRGISAKIVLFSRKTVAVTELRNVAHFKSEHLNILCILLKAKSSRCKWCLNTRLHFKISFNLFRHGFSTGRFAIHISSMFAENVRDWEWKKKHGANMNIHNSFLLLMFVEFRIGYYCCWYCSALFLLADLIDGWTDILTYSFNLYNPICFVAHKFDRRFSTKHEIPFFNHRIFVSITCIEVFIFNKWKAANFFKTFFFLILLRLVCTKFFLHRK